MISELFVTQTHLSLDDPEGPYTCGKPTEVADWLQEYITAVADRPADETRPERRVIDLVDESALVVVFQEQETKIARVADLRHLRSRDDWNADSDAWVLIGGQPGAQGFIERLADILEEAEHPEQILLGEEAEPGEWAETLINARRGELGAEARRTAHGIWEGMRAHRARTFYPDDADAAPEAKK